MTKSKIKCIKISNIIDKVNFSEQFFLNIEGGYKLFGLAQNFAINKKSTI